MKKYDWDKLFTLGENRAKYFKWVAEPVVECSTHTDAENMKTIQYLSAIDMAIGEEVTKNKHIITGVIIGTLGTLVTMKISKGFRKKWKEKRIIDRLAEKGIVIDKED